VRGRLDAGSEELEGVVARFAGLMRSIGRAHRLDDAEIDEVIQDVRVRLWRRMSAGERIEAKPSSYLHRTATTAALDLIKRRRAARMGEGDHATLAEVRAAGRGPAEQAEHRELAGRISQAIETIVPSRRPVVRMYLAGYSPAEIAAALSWTEPKARNLVFRGLAELRERLVAMGIGPEG
jgi:RNA polymerase sigma-70 factor (ECF subfamily)